MAQDKRELIESNPLVHSELNGNDAEVMNPNLIELAEAAKDIGESTLEGAKAIGEVSVKISVDVTEALTGLKAVQREAKKATQALAALRETDRLAEFFMREMPDEIREGSAVDNAIRILREKASE